MVRDYNTEVSEVREEGIILTGRGRHVVRIFAAAREVPSTPRSGNRESDDSSELDDTLVG